MRSRFRRRWQRLHRATRIAAWLGALATLLVLGPIFAAVLLLRCCGSVHGAEWGAWVVAGVLLVVAALLAAVAAALLAAGVRRLLRRPPSA